MRTMTKNIMPRKGPPSKGENPIHVMVEWSMYPP